MSAYWAGYALVAGAMILTGISMYLLLAYLRVWFGGLIAAGALGAAGCWLMGYWPLSAGFAAATVFAVWLLTRFLRRRKRARRTLGAKSRALVADLVERARDTAQRRPVLIPGGAG